MLIRKSGKIISRRLNCIKSKLKQDCERNESNKVKKVLYNIKDKTETCSKETETAWKNNTESEGNIGEEEIVKKEIPNY